MTLGKPMRSRLSPVAAAIAVQAVVFASALPAPVKPGRLQAAAVFDHARDEAIKLRSEVRSETWSKYVIRGRHRISFGIERTDRETPQVNAEAARIKPCCIDDGSIVPKSMAVDATGYIYIAGWTDSFFYPTTKNAFQRQRITRSNLFKSAFVMKLDPSAHSLIYSTYLCGARGNQQATGIAVDRDGNAYICGFTNARDFPVTKRAYQKSLIGSQNAFVAKLDPRGRSLVYSTLLGGGQDAASSIAIDPDGNACVAGSTSSPGFPTTPGAYQTGLGSVDPSHPDAFIAKLDLSGSALVYSTMLGGAYDDTASAIALDSAGNAYVTGSTTSGGGFPSTAGAFTTESRSEKERALVARDGNSRPGAAANPSAANTTAANTAPGDSDVFVAKLSSDGRRLIFSARFGGTSADYSSAITIDSSGSPVITGATYSPDFPTAHPFQADYSGGCLLSSTDSGATWSKLDRGLPGQADGSIVQSVSALVVDPEMASIVYAGVAIAGSFYMAKSTDAGATWLLVPMPGMVTRIAVGPAARSTVYAGLAAPSSTVTPCDTGATNDAGSTNDAGPTRGAGSTHSTGGASEAAVFTSGIFKSTNGGSSFTPVGLSDHGVYSLLVDPSDNSSIFVGTPDGFFRSSDSGATWLQGDKGNGGATFADLMIDANTKKLYGATDGGLSVSTDRGATWQRIALLAPLIALMQDPFGQGAIYAAALPIGCPITLGDEARVNPRRRAAGVAEGLVVSSDGGHTWVSGEAGLPDEYLDYHFAVDFQSRAMYAGTYDGLFRSITPIALWRPTGLRETTITALAVAPNAAATLYAGVAPTADAFIARLSPDGSSLIYSSFVGGSNHDAGLGIALDGAGNAYVTGGTQSADFPATAGAFQASNNGGRDDPYSGDGFMIKVGPAGDLVYATYFGGKQAEAGAAIAISPDGNIVVSGLTSSTDFPNLYPSPIIGISPFILKFGDHQGSVAHH
jgi:hypothetical protein